MEALTRVVTVLTSPEKAFREVAARPAWVAPLLVLLVLGGAVSGLVISKIDPASQADLIREQMEDRGLRGDDLDRAVEQGAAVYDRIKPFFPFIGLFFMVAAYLIAGAVLWGGVNFAGGEASFVTAWSTTLYGLMPQAVSALLTVPVVLGMESIDAEAMQSGSILASNLAFFAPEDAELWLRTLLASFDFFAIWSVVLLAIGFRVTARLSKGTSAAVVVCCWLLSIAARTGWTALVG